MSIDRRAEDVDTDDELVAVAVNRVSVLVTETTVVGLLCSVEVGAETAAFAGTTAAFEVGVSEILISAIEDSVGAGAVVDVLE